MSIEQNIRIMVERLFRANIPIDNLCYKCSKDEWEELARVVSQAIYQNEAHPQDMHNVRYMGLHIWLRE